VQIQSNLSTTDDYLDVDLMSMKNIWKTGGRFSHLPIRSTLCAVCIEFILNLINFK
jgi:hypothetical protein